MVVKIPKEGHDERFDIPVIGLKTIKVMRRIGAQCLVVQAKGCLILIPRACASSRCRWNSDPCNGAYSVSRSIFISAGELSGDLHAARVMKALHAEDGSWRAFGLGGDALAQERVTLMTY